MGKTLQPGVPWLNSRLEACNGPEAENSQKKVSQWFPGVNKKLGLEAEIKRKANVCYGFEQAEALWIRSTKWKRQSCTGRRVTKIFPWSVNWQIGCRFFFLIKEKEKCKPASPLLRSTSGSDCDPTAPGVYSPSPQPRQLILLCLVFSSRCLSSIEQVGWV